MTELPSDIWLVLCGTADRNVYESVGLKELPARVFLTGYVPEEELHDLYAGSLAFVYPSLAEGFGLPPLEAMACGVPVLTSNTTAIPEVCGSAALYADPTNTEEIAKAIKRIATDAGLRDRLSLLGKERAASFTWERAAVETLKILRAYAVPRDLKPTKT